MCQANARYALAHRCPLALRLSAAAAAGYRNGSTIALYSSPNTWAKQPTMFDSTETIEGRLGWTGVEVTPEG